MSMRSQFLLAVFPTLLIGISASLTAAPPQDAEKAKLQTFQKATGETSFALSLSPNVATSPSGSVDLLVLFDTSASQTGLYRDDALESLKTLLATMNEKDRVKLVAVDLTSVAMTENFVSPTGAEMKRGLAKLEARAPLGSTDMAGALVAAADEFGAAKRTSRSVIYIGDGMSRANWMADREFGDLMSQLVMARVPVSSYAIGPKRDIHLLAAVANHTGGMVYVDSQETTGAMAGRDLLSIVKGNVIWPVSVKLPTAMSEAYPVKLPPLRSDRDSILVGVLDSPGTHNVSMTGEVNGRQVDYTWDVSSQPSNPDLSYLPQMVDGARDNGGWTLPTVGTAGLQEAGRMVMNNAHHLSKLGGHALASGDVKGAKVLAGAALASDPGNPAARSIRNAVLRKEKDGSSGRRGEVTLRLVADAADAATDPGFLRSGEGRFLGSVDDAKAILQGKIQAEVEAALKDARDRMSEDATGAIRNLKLQLENVERAAGLSAEVRANLRSQIEFALRDAGRRELEIDRRRALAQQNLAAALQNARLASQVARDNERIYQLMGRFASLMDEERFVEAEYDVATQVRELAPDDPIGQSASFNSRFAGQIVLMDRLRELRHAKFAEALYQVELSHVPHPDDQWILYPDPEEWEELTMKRLKYRSVDLGGSGGEEQRIQAALDEDTSLEFIETPLQDVIDFLEDRHKIQIELDTKALDVVGIGSDTPISRELSGVSLRSALRLMLRELELTYMIQDEVLLITTQEEADANLITKVYPVGDLVVPVSSGGINPFGGGGGLGGGGGGGGGRGGGGGLGGGGGRGGGFGGGGGGILAVGDLKLGGKKKKVEKKTTDSAVRRGTSPKRSVERIQPVVKSGMTVQQVWNHHFAIHEKVDPATIRETIRSLMVEGKRLYHRQINEAADNDIPAATKTRQQAMEKCAEAAAVLQAALSHSQPQPWMYEALGLALEASGAPDAEIERALMSAVDFSKTVEDMMIVALYMSRIGLDERALSLFREISDSHPSRPEPYVEGLRVAKRLENIEGVKWACVGILSKGWPEGHQSIYVEADKTARGMILDLKRDKHVAEAEELQKAYDLAVARDCKVQIFWTGDADIDMMVEEPAGTVCSFRNPRTTAGGVMLGDAFSKPEGAGINGYSEEYQCAQGFPGKYRILLRKVYGNVTTGKVTVILTRNEGTDKETVKKKQVPLNADNRDVLVVFDLEEGRRTEALSDQQIATAVQQQASIGRAALLQQLSYAENSRASKKHMVATKRAFEEERLGPKSRRGVGYRPVITILPEGAFMFATAVVSADRRYVRVSPLPFFSSIGQVDTFTFTGGAN